MNDELAIINKLGMVTSSELQEMIDKNIRTIIRNLNRLNNANYIHIVLFNTEKIRRRLYINEEIYNDFIKIKKS